MMISWNSNPNDSGVSFDFDNYFHSGEAKTSFRKIFDDQLIADGIKVVKINM